MVSALGRRYYFRAYAEVRMDQTGRQENLKSKKDLLALWRLDEDSGNIALDSVVPSKKCTHQWTGYQPNPNSGS